MLPVCYDPYVGTLGRFTRAEIVSMVADAGYDGLNVPVNAAFLGDFTASEVDDLVTRLRELRREGEGVPDDIPNLALQQRDESVAP